MAQRGYRSKDSYASKNPTKRQNQLDNLKHSKGKKKEFPLITKTRYLTDDSSGIKLFIKEQCRNLEGKKAIVLPWYQEVLYKIFPVNEEERVTLFLARMDLRLSVLPSSCLILHIAISLNI